jgi:threonine dehydrogenase-like Zn-dependent dehydrogenase
LAPTWASAVRRQVTEEAAVLAVVLRDLIAAGRIRLSEIVSHPLPFDAAPDAYRRFDRRRDGYLKPVVDPAAS